MTRLQDRLPTVAEWGGGLGDILSRSPQRRRIPFPRTRSEFLDAVSTLEEDATRETSALAAMGREEPAPRGGTSEDSPVVLHRPRRIVDIDEFGGHLDEILLPSPPCRRVGRRHSGPAAETSHARDGGEGPSAGGWAGPSPRRPPSAARAAAGPRPPPPAPSTRDAPFGGRSLGEVLQPRPPRPPGRPPAPNPFAGPFSPEPPSLPSPHLARLRAAREDPLAYRPISPELRPRDFPREVPEPPPLLNPGRPRPPRRAGGLSDFAADAELTYEALLALDEGLHRARAALPKPPIRSTRVRYGTAAAPLPKKGEPADECSVCLAELRRNDQCRRLPCRHLFHESCIMPWLKQDDRCPNCRACCRGPPRPATSKAAAPRPPAPP